MYRTRSAYYDGDYSPISSPRGSRYRPDDSRVIDISRTRSMNDRQPRHRHSSPKKEKKFLREVQNELEEQRNEWKNEVDNLTERTLPRTLPKSAETQGTSSFVDTSSGRPIYKAYIDVSEFPVKTISVSYDNITNRVLIRAEQSNGRGNITKTFTQKVQLPRFADEQRLVSRLSKDGIMKIEVPLIYYFPQDTKKKDKSARSFVNEVKTNRDGRQILEILVNTGGIPAKDLRVRVDTDNTLLIMAERRHDGRLQLIKRYTLPPLADVDSITSRMGKDGRLSVHVPLRRSAVFKSM